MKITGITVVSRRKRKSRTFIIILIILVMLTIFTVTSISAYISWGMFHPKKSSVESLSLDTLPEYKDILFTGQDKTIPLRGWFFESKGSKNTVVIAHGSGKNRLQFEEQTIDMIKGFVSNGYNVFAFDLRNSGLSGGKISTLGFYEKEDVIGAVNYIKSLGYNNIAVLGFSTGASAAILAASVNKDINALILDSPLLDIKKYIHNYVTSIRNLPSIPFSSTVPICIGIMGGIEADKANPQNVINNIVPRPILFIHSKGDRLVLSENIKEIHLSYVQASAGKSELWETDGTQHTGSYIESPSAYMNKVLSFLESVF